MCRPATAADYAGWLVGYLADGGQISTVTSTPLPAADWFVLAGRPDGPVPSLYGRDSVNLIVADQGHLTPADVPRTFHGRCGHNDLYFMRGRAALAAAVPLYPDVLGVIVASSKGGGPDTQIECEAARRAMTVLRRQAKEYPELADMLQAAKAGGVIPEAPSDPPLHAHQVSHDDAAMMRMLAGATVADGARFRLPSGRPVSGGELRRWLSPPRNAAADAPPARRPRNEPPPPSRRAPGPSV